MRDLRIFLSVYDEAEKSNDLKYCKCKCFRLAVTWIYWPALPQTHELTMHRGCHSWGSRILTQITQVCAMCSEVIWNKVFCDSTNLGLVKEMGLGTPQDSSDGQKCTNCILWSVCMYYGMYKIKWKSSLSIDPGYNILLHNTSTSSNLKVKWVPTKEKSCCW